MRGLGKDIGDFITGLRRRKPYAHLEDQVRAAIVHPSRHGIGLYPGASPELYAGLTPQQQQPTSNAPKPRIILNQNPVVIAQSPVQLAQDYVSRQELKVTNSGTVTIYIGFGFSPTSTNYTHALAGCSAADDGTGGVLIDDLWKGNVWAVAGSATGGKVIFVESP